MNRTDQHQHQSWRHQIFGKAERRRSLRPKQHRKRHSNEINYNYLSDLGVTEDKEDAGSEVVYSYCNLKKRPVAVQSCFLGSCVRNGMADSFVWRPMPWQQCDRSCGDGKQTRKVICVSVRTGAKVNGTKCSEKHKPVRKRPCNRRDCGVTSCLDMRERSRTRVDGEYDLTVQGASIRVYCYGMGSLVQPLEYLQLHSTGEDDEEENFSQLVHRPSDCSLVKEAVQQQRISTLFFKYVRLNVSSLELIVGDTMFASTKETTTTAAATTTTSSGGSSRRRSVLINERSLGFGEAVVQGCPEYRAPGTVVCHFGGGSDDQQQPQQPLVAKFSINLQKTGLAVAPEAHWDRIGPKAYVRRGVRRSKGGQKVEGFCRLDTTINLSEGLLFLGTGAKSAIRSSVCRLGCQPVPGGAIPLVVL